MRVFIDDGKGDDWFFVSVPVSDTEAISFDYTLKGHRVLKQILVSKKPFPTDQSPTMEWDTLILQDGKLAGKQHVCWLDQDKNDWVNDEIWQTTWEKPITDDVRDKLLHFSNLVRQHADNLDAVAQEVSDFENFISKLVVDFSKKD